VDYAESLLGWYGVKVLGRLSGGLVVSDDLGKGFDPGVFGRFDLAALAQPHLKFLFVCLYRACDSAWGVGMLHLTYTRAPMRAMHWTTEVK
jgi:hypothetical protein